MSEFNLNRELQHSIVNSQVCKLHKTLATWWCCPKRLISEAARGMLLLFSDVLSSLWAHQHMKAIL